ncbi:MAG: hypothetical protein E7639_04360 [Ruminococcaceae bacterium]|nr:hypothetical protein [Oscillospiraceae bacterium]
MKKHEFLAALEKGLAGLPAAEIAARVAFFGEMIDDRMEEGLSEEAAVAAMGAPDEVAAQIVKEMPLGTLIKEKIKPRRRLETWEIVLLVVGAPLWVSLLVSLISGIVSLYASLWSGIASLWAAFGATVASAVGGVLASLPLFFVEDPAKGLFLLGSGVAAAGVSILLFYAALFLTKGLVRLTKACALKLKYACMGRSEG